MPYMANSRPQSGELLGKSFDDVPASLQRIVASSATFDPLWIGPKDAETVSSDELESYKLAHQIAVHLSIQAPTKHKSGHPGGMLSSFTFAYFLRRRRDPKTDQPLRISAGHLSLLAYGLDWIFGSNGSDPRLASPQSIIDTFRTPSGLPGHIEAGIGTIPFGTGPLGKGVSNALGAAFGLKYLKKPGTVDVLLADGDAQEGQVMEAFRLASHLNIDNLVVHGDWNDIQLSGLPSETVASDFAKIAQASGWRVIEVQNGNDPAQVAAALSTADSFVGKNAPIFICYYTTMGHGVSLMENGSNTGEQNFHGTPLKDDDAKAALEKLPSLETLVAKFETHRYRISQGAWTGAKAEALAPPPKTQRIIITEKGAARTDFGAVHIKNLMKSDSRIVVLHADLAGSGGFDRVGKEFPDRVINVGVAEANMYMMAAGMRQVGLLPVTYTFAAFGTNEARANARLIDINCGHTRCGILNDCTHAGTSVGEDGETHQERHYLDIPFDHTRVWMPGDSNQAAAAAERAFEFVADGSQSIYTFFPRSSHEQLKSPNGEVIYGSNYIFDERADLIRGRGDSSDQATIISTGITLHEAVAAADTLAKEHKIQVRLLNVASIRPLDAASIVQAALETVHIIVVEDHSSESGLASGIADVIADFQLPCSLRRLGVNQYFPSATDKDLRLLAGIDSYSIVAAVQDEMRAEVKGGEDALITVLFSILHNSEHSRFRISIESFLMRLRTENGYLQSLREMWQKRQPPEEQLPSNEELMRRLQKVS